MRVSGFLFLLILTTLFASSAFGNKIGDFDSDDKLQKIYNDPKKYQISIVLALIQHVSIIALAIMLFIVVSPYNLILGIAGTIFRIGEDLIQIYNEINTWGLFNLARQYSGTSGAKKNALIDLGLIILQTKNSRWTLATTLYGIGILAYSILFVT